MKKILIAGLLAVSPLLALAHAPKTSKPMPMTDTQMEAVKGQSLMILDFVHMSTGVVTQEIIYIPDGQPGWVQYTYYVQ